jgi:hypothetical protein
MALYSLQPQVLTLGLPAFAGALPVALAVPAAGFAVDFDAGFGASAATAFFDLAGFTAGFADSAAPSMTVASASSSDSSLSTCFA